MHVLASCRWQQVMPPEPIAWNWVLPSGLCGSKPLLLSLPLFICNHVWAGIELGSGTPKKEVVGQITMAQVEEIAKTKLPDTNAVRVESVIPMIVGTAKNMGVKVVE